MMVIAKSAIPAKHFATPPYKAMPSGGDNDWWYVQNAQGVNCLTFSEKPGAVMTTKENALKIAEHWNTIN